MAGGAEPSFAVGQCTSGEAAALVEVGVGSAEGLGQLVPRGACGGIVTDHN